MKRILSYILLTTTTFGILGICAVIGLYIWFGKDLPSITRVHDYRPAQVTTIYARDNSILGYFFREKRFLINLDQMPRHLIDSFLGAEDSSFYTHHGVDIKAIVAAFVVNLKEGDVKRGGSTITQQVVKRLLLTSEKSYERKVKEAILAYRLEKYLTKEEILYIYLNQIYLGNSSYGVEAAARTYFGKNAKDLTLGESAVLAGLPQAPSRNNPYREPEHIKSRQVGILNNMLNKGFINQRQYQEAVEQELVYTPMPDPSWKLGAWYLEEVRRQLITFLSEENVKRLGLQIDMYGEQAVYEAGLHVYTAMDPVHQESAEKALRQGLYDAYRRSGWHGPIRQIPLAEMDDFLKRQDFTPASLDNAGWAQALVTAVEKEGASVRLGEYKGRITLAGMPWARTPNLRVTPEGAGKRTDAQKVLAPGDIIWVSAVGTSGDTNPVGLHQAEKIPAYDSAAVTRETVLPLALEQLPKIQGAVASIDVASGDLVAIVGGYDFSPDSQFNRATQARRQPGSSFKPVVYSASLDNGFTAASVLMDSPFVLVDPWTKRVWKPGNFDGKFLGPIILRTAIAKSRNVCTVRVAEQIGMQSIIERSHALGIEGDIPAVLAVSLGSWEVTPLGMAEAYTAFANQGTYLKPRIITSIANCWDEALVNFEPDRRPAISPQNAFVMACLLKDVVNAGTAAQARVLGRPVAGKTGTSNEERDAWFIGFSPYLVTSVYIGYDDHGPMGRMETGGRAAVPVFINYRKKIDHLYPAEDFVRPNGITMMTVNPESGYPSSSGLTLPFIAGTEHNVGGDGLFGAPPPEDVQGGEDLLRQIF